VRQLSALPDHQVRVVIAITRNNDCPALQKLIAGSSGRAVNVVVQDITDERIVKEALPRIEQHLPGGILDVLVNNAGVMPISKGSMEAVSNEQLQDVFKTNVGSVQAMTSVLLPLLERGVTRKVINISTILGSIGGSRAYSFSPAHAYKISKAALNMLTAQYAADFAERDFTFLAISPGWLKTDLGGQQADLDVSVGAESVKKWILNGTEATVESSSTYMYPVGQQGRTATTAKRSRGKVWWDRYFSVHRCTESLFHLRNPP